MGSDHRRVVVDGASQAEQVPQRRDACRASDVDVQARLVEVDLETGHARDDQAGPTRQVGNRQVDSSADGDREAGNAGAAQVGVPTKIRVLPLPEVSAGERCPDPR